MEQPTPDNVVDLSARRLSEMVDAGSAPPRAIPAPLLAKLRTLNTEISERQRVQQALIDGCVHGLGIDLETSRVEFNLDTGTIAVTTVAASVA